MILVMVEPVRVDIKMIVFAVILSAVIVLPIKDDTDTLDTYTLSDGVSKPLVDVIRTRLLETGYS